MTARTPQSNGREIAESQIDRHEDSPDLGARQALLACQARLDRADGRSHKRTAWCGCCGREGRGRCGRCSRRGGRRASGLDCRAGGSGASGHGCNADAVDRCAAAAASLAADIVAQVYPKPPEQPEMRNSTCVVFGKYA